MLEFMPLQQAVKRQLIQIDQIGVSREGRIRGIGRIPVACGIDRQDLPDTLSIPFQQIDEVPRRLTHGPDAIGTRQRRYVKHYAVFSHVRHSFLFSMKIL